MLNCNGDNNIISGILYPPNDRTIRTVLALSTDDDRKQQINNDHQHSLMIRRTPIVYRDNVKKTTDTKDYLDILIDQATSNNSRKRHAAGDDCNRRILNDFYRSRYSRPPITDDSTIIDRQNYPKTRRTRLIEQL